jgi:hypothetical protein
MPTARNSHSRSVSEVTRVIRLPVFLRHVLAQERHEAQPHPPQQRAQPVRQRDGRDAGEGDAARRRAVEPPLLHGPGDAVDEVAGQVGRHQRQRGHPRRRAHAGGHLPPVGREVAQQAQDDGVVAVRDQRLGLADRPRHRLGVAVVGVARRPPLAGQRPAHDVHRPPLPVRVPQHRQRRLPRLAARDDQQVAAQAGGVADLVDARALERLQRPAAGGRAVAVATATAITGRARDHQPVGPQHQPRLVQAQRRVQVAQRVRLDGAAAERALDARPHPGGQPGRLIGVTLDDLAVPLARAHGHVRWSSGR